MGLGIVEFAIDVERRFDIKVPEERFGNMRTVADMLKTVVELLEATREVEHALGSPPRPALCRDEVRATLCDLVARHSSCEARDVTDDHLLVDLFP